MVIILLFAEIKVLLLPLSRLNTNRKHLTNPSTNEDDLLNELNRLIRSEHSPLLIHSPQSIQGTQFSLSDNQRQLNRFVQKHKRKVPQPNCRTVSNGRSINRLIEPKYRSDYDLDVVRKLYSAHRNWFVAITNA
jgi:hypothetical protein